MPDPAREVRGAADGTPLVAYVRRDRDGVPWADRVEVLAPGAVDALAGMRGWTVTCDRPLAVELAARGARPLRNGDRMTRDLVADPPPPEWSREGFPGVAFTPCDRPPADLVPAWVAAYAPGHPDHVDAPDEVVLRDWLAPLVEGVSHGPLLPQSTLAVDGEGEVVAGLLLHRIAGDVPWGGPWITGVFRLPDRRYAGIGSVLVRRALADAAAAGLPAVGLVVTEGNPAAVVYERTGFKVLDRFGTVAVPD